MKKSTALLRCFLLCVKLRVPDIEQIAVGADCFAPYPNIRDGFICGIAIQTGTNIPFKIDTVRICINRCIPAIDRRAFRPQSHAFGVGFGIVDPSLDVKLRLGRFFCGRRFGFLHRRFGGYCRWRLGCFRRRRFRSAALGRQLSIVHGWC